MKIKNVDQVVAQELATRGVDSSVGIFGEHHVKIGKGSPIRLDEIKSAAVPPAAFDHAQQISNGQDGVRQTAEAALKVLVKAGPLDAAGLLGLLKAGQTHLTRLANLGQLTPAQLQDQTWMFTQAVANMSNAELAAAYQTFSSAEMDLLQTSLQREGEVNRKAVDARMAAERLFDMQALVLREAANRAVLANLEDMRADAPNDATLNADALRLPKSATEAYGSAGGEAVTEHDNDLAAQNLGTLIETAASSATQRERTADAETASLRRREFKDVTLHEIGDVMRSKELTINMGIDTLVTKSGILTDPSKPIDQIWSLKERGIKVKSDGYCEKRDAVEQVHFPELNRPQGRGATRPVYSALNLQGCALGASPGLYGSAVIVLKKDVAKRATYTVNDSFSTVALTIDAQRRDTFFKLFETAPLMPESLKSAMSKADSAEHKAMEKWLDRTAEECRRGRGTSGLLCAERDLPKEVTKHFKGKDEGSLKEAMIAFIIKCFGDREATRKATATYDNIESLIPNIGQANSAALAEAAKERRAGRDPKLYLTGTAYVEAQIHGPIVPERDIEEIRINLDDDTNPMDEEERAQAREDLMEFSRRSGVRVVFINDTFESTSDELTVLQERTKKINAAHQDMPAVEKRRDEIIADLKGEAAHSIATSKWAEWVTDLEIELDGKALDKVLEKFQARLASSFGVESEANSAVQIVEMSFGEAVSAVLSEKAELMKELNKLEFASPEQKKTFAKWVLATGYDLTIEQMRLVQKHAKAKAEFLSRIAAANPPMDHGEVLKGLAELAKNFGDDVALGNGFDRAADSISSAALVLALADAPAAAAEKAGKLNAVFGSSEMRTYSAQLARLVQEPEFAGLADAGALDTLRAYVESAAINTARLAGAAPWTPPKAFSLPLPLLDNSIREVVELMAPQVANRLEFRYPANPPFPKPANVGAMPKTPAERRRFLVSVMEEYRQKELVGTERGRSYHGRGHIVRAYIYATVMANILAEQGVKMDFNAILCGIAGHDLARARTGKDKWEAQSGHMTVDAMKKSYGGGAMGEAYENEIIDSITGVEVEFPDGTKMSLPKSATLEAHILQSADSLDIGRVKDFDPKQFAFLQFGEKNLPPEIANLREQLAKEADMLQRLTYPLREKRDEMQRLATAALEQEDAEAEQALATIQQECEDRLIAEAEDGDNEAFVKRVEDAIRNNTQHFPLLSKYYV